MSEIIRPETINFENGIKDQPTFSAEEMASRNSKLRAHLSENNIDAAIFSSIHNINYYADFVYCSFGRPYALVVTHDEHTTVSANIDDGRHGDKATKIILSTPTGKKIIIFVR